MTDRLRTRLDAGRQDNGFTLIELLIVIVILGVLAGIVVFAVGGITDRGQNSACKSDLKSVEVAVEAYRAKTGGYPTGASSDARYALLTASGAAYLKSKPDGGNNYEVNITDNTGSVSARDRKGTADTTDDDPGCPPAT